MEDHQLDPQLGSSKEMPVVIHDNEYDDESSFPDANQEHSSQSPTIVNSPSRYEESDGEDDNRYEVDFLCARRRVSDTVEYYVKWKDYDHEYNQWVKAEDIDPEVIAEYEKIRRK
ncbi:Chromo domain-like protein [Niveomyces insectorum RCEF 264]|uniref:Chromo domain-like protein n=1 Tax=Niveomyces insectorum RCEF 264 TaxID=1081102 RepID=A0A167W3H1_9HYPO|nr:Chromo domain-like protein [Niveomyces insectorum RCEF 264]